MRQIGRERGKDREVRERERERERCTHMYIIICYLSSVPISIIKSLSIEKGFSPEN